MPFSFFIFCGEKRGGITFQLFTTDLSQGCYCERLLTTGANNQPNGTKPGKDGDEKTVKFYRLILADRRIFCSFVSG